MRSLRPLHLAAPAAASLIALAGGSVVISAAHTAPTPSDTPAPQPAAAPADAASASPARYVGRPEVVRDVAAKPARTANGKPAVTGRVFVDRNRDSRSDRRERGLAGVRVTNGRDVVVTDRQGRYTLPAFDNMTVTITQPAGFQVPVDEHNIAQFHYNHLPAGTPEKLRFGGIAPTGPLPTALNFPLVRSTASAAKEQSCVIAGDLQTYSRREIGYARDGVLRDLADRGPLSACGTLFIGDVAGDDLGLYPEMKKVLPLIDGPVRFLPGNHDLDLDAKNPNHSHDTFRAQMGPEYYSYDVGQTHVIALNDVKFPCAPDVDNADGRRPSCNDPLKKPAYNGRLDPDQLAWLENDLKNTPKDKLVVIASHIPFLTYADMGSPIHQLDQVKDVYRMLEGRKAVHVSGHTHSIENLKTGDSYGPWKEVMGVDRLPFPHLIAGAISGDWYSGDLDENSVPMAFQRDGGRPGVVTLDIAGNAFKERFTVRGEDDDVQMNVGLSSPHWRQWYTTLDEWRKKNPNNASGATPPLNYNDLGDPRLVTPQDLDGTSWLTANFWMGSTDSTVTVSLDGKAAAPATKVQKATGEGQLVGAEYADPVAATKQLSVNRTAQESTSGDPLAQGYRLYRGSQYGPGPARPGNNLADRMHHLWRFDLPKDLAPGVHHARFTATDSYGRTFTDSVTFTVAEKREKVEARKELFETK